MALSIERFLRRGSPPCGRRDRSRRRGRRYACIARWASMIARHWTGIVKPLTLRGGDTGGRVLAIARNVALRRATP
jgi:hypothetical protein